MDIPFKMIVETEIEQYRYNTFWTKEPETIEWIKSFDDYDVFIDVGANIGIYSLYCAAMHPQCRIYAFEPDAKNFLRLVKNKELNNFYNITTMAMAIGGKLDICRFYEASTISGDSGGQVGIENDQTNYDIQVQTIDSIMEMIKPMNIQNVHIKIDIDGQELKVIQGMIETLKKPELRSVLIEVTESNKAKIVCAFLNSGFTTDNDFNKMENHSSIRRETENILVENIVFIKGKEYG